MATAEEYSAQILERLDRLKGKLEEETVPGRVGASRFSLQEFVTKLGAILAELETHHARATRTLKALSVNKPPAADDNEVESPVSFLLYHLHHPPEDVQRYIDRDERFSLVWKALQAVAPDSSFTPETMAALELKLPKGNQVKCNEWGDIWGFSTYEQLDKGWAWTLVNVLLNHMPRWGKHNNRGIHDFNCVDWSQTMTSPLPAKLEIRVALIGDWGSGDYKLQGLENPEGPAVAVMEDLAKLTDKPDVVIHMGDTYYAGTSKRRPPRGEETNNLVKVWQRYPDLANDGRCFTLNSNHEMYGGAWGYFDDALSQSLFSAQQGCSYFALPVFDWIIAGIDSAYFDNSTLYMKGGLGSEKEDPQYKFLAWLKSTGKKIILLSHHTGLSTDGSHTTQLWKDVTSILYPHYWYWGHTHLGMVYNDKAQSKEVRTRCVGHSSMPFAIPPGFEKRPANICWYAKAPLDSGKSLEAMYYDSPRAKNGFAMLTLGHDSIKEEFYEIGNSKPVWTSPCKP